MSLKHCTKLHFTLYYYRMSVQSSPHHHHQQIYLPMNDNYYKQQPIYSSVTPSFRPLKPPRKNLNRNPQSTELEEYAKRYKDIHSKRSSFINNTNYCTLPKQVRKVSRTESIREECINNNNNSVINQYSTMSLPRKLPPVKKLVSAFNHQIESSNVVKYAQQPTYAKSLTLQRNCQMNDRRQMHWEVDRRSAERIIELWRRQIEVRAN